MIIEENVPIPEGRRGRQAKYPFSEMKPGQSFAVEVGDEPPRTVINRLNTAAQGWRRRNKPTAKFVVRLEPDRQHVRIWLESL